jgi:hypothetical protein
VVSVGSGIIFFQEYKEVDTINLIVMGSSLGGCCCGIYVATMSKRLPPPEDEKPFDSVSTGGRQSSIAPGDGPGGRRTTRKSVADKYLRKTGERC